MRHVVKHRWPMKIGAFLCVALLAAACAPSETSSSTTTTSAEPAPTETSAPSTTAGPQELKPLTLRIGRFPVGAAQAFLTQYMINEGLLEEVGREFGYELDVEWLNMANAVATAQALTAGELDMGPMGAAGYYSLLAAEQAVTPIMISEGRFKMVIAVPPDSDIRTIDDLVGRRVGTIFGTGLQDALTSVIEAHFGTPNAEEAGIELVNVSGIAALATVSEGIDASIVTLTSWLQAREELGITAIANIFGYTEDHYEGPLGSGAGILIPEAQNSPFWPDGYASIRGVVVARDSVIEEHPGAVAAYILATTRAIEALNERTPANAASISSPDWGLEPQVAAEIVSGELLMRRGWPYLTEGDVEVMLMQAQLLFDTGSLERELTWEDFIGGVAKGAEVSRQAYEAAGVEISEEEFLDNSEDKRGLPNWEYERWEDR